MNIEFFIDQMQKDLKKLNLPYDFNLVLKKLSKRYWGKYNPNNSNLILYCLDEEGRVVVPYNKIFKHLIHEAVHHYQWKHCKNFIRYKGVMHNSDFYKLEVHYNIVFLRLFKDRRLECENKC